MKIPVQELPDVQGQPTPNVNVQFSVPDIAGTVASGMHAFSQGLGNAVQAGAGAYKDAKSQADAAATANGIASLQEWTNNAYTQFSQAKGEEAMRQADGFYDAWDKTRDKVYEGLNNEEQRKAFDAHAREIWLHTNHQVETHVAQQSEVAKQASKMALEQSGLNAVSLSYRNDALAANQQGVFNQSVDAMGGADDAKAMEKQKYAADLAATRINAALDDQHRDYDYAQTLFDSSKEILGPRREEIEKRISALRNQTQADAKAQQFVQEHMDDSGRPIEGAIWQEVDKQPPGKAREELHQEVQKHLAQANASWHQAEQDRLGRVIQGVEDSGGNLDRSTDDFQKLSPANKALAVERQRSLLRTDRNEQRQVDREELARFSAIPPEDRPAVDINTQFPSASPTARFQMQALQNQAKSRQLKGDLEPLKDFDEQVKATSEQLNLSKQDGGDLKAQLDSWYMQKERDNSGKPPTRQEVDQEISRRLQKSKGGWFGWGSKYRFQAAPDEDFEVGKEQPYGKVQERAGPTKAPAQAPTQAPARQKLISVTRNGVTKYWTGTGWVDHE